MIKLTNKVTGEPMNPEFEKIISDAVGECVGGWEKYIREWPDTPEGKEVMAKMEQWILYGYSENI